MKSCLGDVLLEIENSFTKVNFHSKGQIYTLFVDNWREGQSDLEVFPDSQLSYTQNNLNTTEAYWDGIFWNPCYRFTFERASKYEVFSGQHQWP